MQPRVPKTPFSKRLNAIRSQQGVVTGRRISQIMEQAGWSKTDKRLNRRDKDGGKRKVHEWINPKNGYPVK